MVREISAKLITRYLKILSMQRCSVCDSSKSANDFPIGQKACFECQRHKRFVSTYRVSNEHISTVIRGQNGCCAVCKIQLDTKNTKMVHVDHHHDSGTLRGVLCMQCNTSLGLIRENPRTSFAQAEYVCMHDPSQRPTVLREAREFLERIDPEYAEEKRLADAARNFSMQLAMSMQQSQANHDSTAQNTPPVHRDEHEGSIEEVDDEHAHPQPRPFKRDRSAGNKSDEQDSIGASKRRDALIAQRLVQFPDAPLKVTDGQLQCLACSQNLSYKKVDRLKYHLQSKKHTRFVRIMKK